MVFRIKNDKNITAWSDKKDWILETICQIMQIQINLDFEDVVIKALEAKIMPKWYSWMGIHSQHWRKETGHKLWSYWTWDTHKERSETNNAVILMNLLISIKGLSGSHRIRQSQGLTHSKSVSSARFKNNFSNKNISYWHVPSCFLSLSVIWSDFLFQTDHKYLSCVSYIPYVSFFKTGTHSLYQKRKQCRNQHIFEEVFCGCSYFRNRYFMSSQIAVFFKV